jgi:hypothetical protein
MCARRRHHRAMEAIYETHAATLDRFVERAFRWRISSASSSPSADGRSESTFSIGRARCSECCRSGFEELRWMRWTLCVWSAHPQLGFLIRVCCTRRDRRLSGIRVSVLGIDVRLASPEIAGAGRRAAGGHYGGFVL